MSLTTWLTFGSSITGSFLLYILYLYVVNIIIVFRRAPARWTREPVSLFSALLAWLILMLLSCVTGAIFHLGLDQVEWIDGTGFDRLIVFTLLFVSIGAAMLTGFRHPSGMRQSEALPTPVSLIKR